MKGQGMQSLYQRIKSLQARGLTVRHANHFEQTINEYGEKLNWVVDLGEGKRARRAYKTKEEALNAAERMLPNIMESP